VLLALLVISATAVALQRVTAPQAGLAARAMP
jgi:hypothetical protein